MKRRSRKDDAFARILRAKGNPEELDRILQEECRRRTSKKLAATLLSAPGFRFPTELSAEQCTADDVAAFHASLVEEGARVVDLTCGLGIDAFHIARRAESVMCLDMDEAVAAAIKPNAAALGLDNVSAICCDCRTWLDGLPDERYDVTFIDPARRAADGSRLYSLSQCNPDVTQLIPLVEKIASRLIVKASPMLDLSKTLTELPYVKDVYAVGTKAECKELLFDIRFGYEGKASVHAVTVGEGIFSLGEPREVAYARELKAGDIIGEPWPAVMKVQPRGQLSGEQLHPSTFLFRNPYSGFPGNLYEVTGIEDFSSSTMRRMAREGVTASVATRNFPLSADELRKRLRAVESSEIRLMATTLAPNAQILVYLSADFTKNS